ncbi:hypothetical protein [uncultured Methanobrevibacter sp.]|uniref:hypothetical protein n=1 Tax=uncultured Methanobrevibacter sp. TaxID=253161 RepID=UPI002631D46A|nr:hypothetical protein [uncultured Methanobrevibacter sp.]
MDIKKLLVISLILLAVISSLTIVAAGWFDFSGDSFEKSLENPISAPAGTPTAKFDADKNNGMEIVTGNKTHLNNAHSYESGDYITTTYTSKSRIDFIQIAGAAQIQTNQYPDDNESFRIAVDNFYKFCYQNKLPTYYQIVNTEIDDSFSKYFTAPTNETGGSFIKFYDKSNSTVLTQNIVLANDDLYHGGMHVSKDSFNGYDRYSIDFTMIFDVTDNHDLLDKVKKTDHADLHIILNNETGYTGGSIELVIPLEVETDFGI